MLSYTLYKVIHVFGILLVFTALGGFAARALGAGNERSRKLAGMTHGIGLLIVLISGFGLLAKLGVGFPLWVWLKLTIWLLIGGVIVLFRRKPELAPVLWVVLPMLGGVAAYLALAKPG